MRTIAQLVVLLLICGFAVADQDDVDLDPGDGKWTVGGSSLPGERGVVRDDLLAMPANFERAICYYNAANDLLQATKMRYVIRTGPKPADYQSVTITDKNGDESGVRIRWHDYIINKTCDHTAADDCVNSGIPPELWGDFVNGTVEVKDMGSGNWVKNVTRIQIQGIAYPGGNCRAF